MCMFTRHYRSLILRKRTPEPGPRAPGELRSQLCQWKIELQR